MGRVCVWEEGENGGKERLKGLWFAGRHAWVLEKRMAESDVNGNAPNGRI